MQNFRVSVSNIIPSEGSRPDFSNSLYTPCGEYLGIPPVATSVLVTCANPVEAQVVYMYSPGPGYLQMCEIAVYDDSKYWGQGVDSI